MLAANLLKKKNLFGTKIFLFLTAPPFSQKWELSHPLPKIASPYPPHAANSVCRKALTATAVMQLNPSPIPFSHGLLTLLLPHTGNSTASVSKKEFFSPSC